MLSKKLKKLVFNTDNYLLNIKLFWFVVFKLAGLRYRVADFYDYTISPLIFRKKHYRLRKARAIWNSFKKGDLEKASRAFEGFVSSDADYKSFYNYYTMLCFDSYIEYRDSLNQADRIDKIISRVIKKTSSKQWSLTLITHLLLKAKNFSKAEQIIYKELDNELKKDSVSWKKLRVCVEALEYTDTELNRFGKKISNNKIVARVLDLCTKQLNAEGAISKKFLMMLESTIALAHNLPLTHMLEDMIKLIASKDSIEAKYLARYSLKLVASSVRYTKDYSLKYIAAKNVLEKMHSSELNLKHMSNEQISRYLKIATKLEMFDDCNNVIDYYEKKYKKAFVSKQTIRSTKNYFFIASLKLRYYKFKDIASYEAQLRFVKKKVVEVSKKHKVEYLNFSLRSIIPLLMSFGELKLCKKLLLDISKLYRHAGIYQALSNTGRRHADYDFAIKYIDKSTERLFATKSFVDFSGQDIKHFQLFNTMRKQQMFLRDSKKVFSRYPQPTNPRGVVYLSNITCLNSLAMIGMIIPELRKQGYAVISLMEGNPSNEKTGVEYIDKFNQILGINAYTITGTTNNHTVTYNKWTVDWDKKIVECDGVNYYQSFYERIVITNRLFSVDISRPLEKELFNSTMIRVDRALYICKLIYQTFKGKNLPVRFVSANAHISNWCLYKKFCEVHGKDIDMHFINVNPAYQNYYTNLGIKYSTAIGLYDATQFPNLRMPFLARREQFDAWLAKGNTYKKHQVEIDEWLNKNRVNAKELTAEAMVLMDRLKKAKSKGKKVICLFGKIPFDLAVPYDGGPAHSDMKDWINHTIECAKDTDNIFIIKPHPHELRSEIARIANETLWDLIEHKLPDNVIFLGHGWFNNQDLIPILDMGVLWNGTSSLELGARKIPVVMCAHFGRHDYPVDLIYPKDRDDYKNILCSKEKIELAPDLWEKCALLLKYMSTDEVAVPMEYTRRPATNDPIGPPVWYWDQVEKYFKDGDKYVSMIADRFFEYGNLNKKENDLAA